MRRLNRRNTLPSLYDLENPHRHKSVEQILNEAGAEPLNGEYEVNDHGNGYASIVPTESSHDESTEE
jgi:hypothetical protein